MAFRFTHPRLTVPQVVQTYNQKVSVSSGEAVTPDFLYAAQTVHQYIFSRPNLAAYVLWVCSLRTSGQWCLHVACILELAT
jgi:hypothetical protein